MRGAARGRRAPARSWRHAPCLLAALGVGLLVASGAHATLPRPVPEKLDLGDFDFAAGRARDTVRSLDAFPWLLRMRALRPRVAPQHYAAAFDELARQPEPAPGVAAAVDRERALLRRARGEPAAAAEVLLPLGILHHWEVLGPYPTTPEEGLAARPERPPDGALASSRPLPTRPDGLLELDGASPRREAAVIYCRAEVVAARSTPSALRFGAAEAVRIWHNGALVHERDGFTAARPDQDQVGLQLAPGSNTIVFKLKRVERSWGLVARLSAPDGRPLAGVRAVTEPAVFTLEEMSALERDAATLTPAPVEIAPGPISHWEQRAQASAPAEWDAAAIGDKVRVQSAGGRREIIDGALLRRRVAEVVREATPSDAAALVRELATLEREPHRASELIAPLVETLPILHGEPGEESVGEVAPELILALAEVEHRRGRSQRALSLLERLRPAWRASPATALLRAAVLRDAALAGESAHALETAREAAPTTPAVLMAAAEGAQARGELITALELYNRLAATEGERPDVLFWLVELNRALHRPDEALAWSARLAELSPTRHHTPLDQARMLALLGRREAARRAYDDLLARFHDYPEVLVAAGVFAHETGERDRGLSLWHRAAARAPHDSSLRARVAFHAQQRAPGFEAPYRVPAADRQTLIDQFQARSSEDYEDRLGTHIALLDERVAEQLHGRASQFRARLVGFVRAPRDLGERNYRIFFDPLRQKVELLKAQLLLPDGSIGEPVKRRERRLEDSAFGMYYDLHALEVEFDGVVPGAVLSVEYRIVNLDPSPLAPAFGDLVVYQQPRPLELFSHTLLMPAESEIYDRLVRPPWAAEHEARASRSVTRDGEVMVLRHTVRDVPALPDEEDSVGLAERAGYLHLSTLARWSELGRLYSARIEAARRSDETIRSAAAKAVRGLGDSPEHRRERIARLHRVVVDRIRYVALEFGPHGVIPFDLPTVYTRRFGDCKDTSSLLVAMLESVGETAHLALVRHRRRGRIDGPPASLAAFDHAVAVVPGAGAQDPEGRGEPRDLWLDPTMRDAPPGVLPPSIQGATALVLEPDGGRLTTIPYATAEDNRAVKDHEITLDQEGGAVLRADEIYYGHRGAEWRRELRETERRVDFLEEILAHRFPGARVTEVEVEGLTELSLGLHLRYRAELPTFAVAKPYGPDATPALQFAMRAAGEPFSPRASRALATVRGGHKRMTPLDIPDRFRDEITTRVRLPAGWKIDTLPQPTDEESPWAHLRLETRPLVDGGGVLISHSLAFTATRIPAEEVLPLSRFAQEVDRALRRSIVAVPLDSVARGGLSP